MKCLVITILAALLGQAPAQTLVEKLFLVRADTTTVDPYSGMTRTCLFVLPNGHYHMERTFQSTLVGGPETKVFVDVLPAEDLRNLEIALDNEDFARINSNRARGGIIQNMDMLSIRVPREHALQNIEFETAAERKPFEKPLKPFLVSLKTIEKRKVPIARNEAPNGCEVPMVRYRSTAPAGSKPVADDDTRP